MQVPPGFVVVRERARPLAPEERREAILTAVLPLLREKGRDVTTRELAEAAGVAEGTLFRAFGDKDSLLQAGLDKLVDPAAFRRELRAIPLDLPLEDKLTAIIAGLQARFRDVFAIMTVFQLHGPPPRRDGSHEEWLDIVRDLLEPDLHRLAVPVDTLAYYLRLVSFGSSIVPLSAPRPFDAEELAGLVVHGVAVGGPPPPQPPPTRPRPAASARRAA